MKLNSCSTHRDLNIYVTQFVLSKGGPTKFKNITRIYILKKLNGDMCQVCYKIF